MQTLNGIAELQRARRFYWGAIHVKDCSPTWANAYKNQILKALKISPWIKDRETQLSIFSTSDYCFSSEAQNVASLRKTDCSTEGFLPNR